MLNDGSPLAHTLSLWENVDERCLAQSRAQCDDCYSWPSFFGLTASQSQEQKAFGMVIARTGNVRRTEFRSQYLRPKSYSTKEASEDAEYDMYRKSPPLEKDPEHLTKWWAARQDIYPNSRIAFDLLSIPAMAAECERICSSAKGLITTKKNRLMGTTIEANELLRALDF